MPRRKGSKDTKPRKRRTKAQIAAGVSADTPVDSEAAIETEAVVSDPVTSGDVSPASAAGDCSSPAPVIPSTEIVLPEVESDLTFERPRPTVKKTANSAVDEPDDVVDYVPFLGVTDPPPVKESKPVAGVASGVSRREQLRRRGIR